MDQHAPKDLRIRVLTAVFWRSGSQLLSQILLWASTLLVIRLLSPADYGLMAMAQSFNALVAVLSSNGIAVALIHAHRLTPRLIGQAFGLLILLNVGLAFVLVAGGPFVADYYGEPILRELLLAQAVNYLLTPFIAIPTALGNRGFDFKTTAINNVVAGLLSSAATLAAAYAGWGVWSLVIGQVSLFLVRAVMMQASMRWLIWPVFDFRGAGDTMRFGSAIMLTTFLWFLYSQSDIYIGGRLLLTHDMGIYSTAMLLAKMASAKLLPALNEVGISAYARTRDNPAQLAWNFTRVVRVVSLLTMPVYMGMAATAPLFVPLVLGDQWRDAIVPLQIAALAMPVFTLHCLFSPATNAIGQPGIATRSTLVGLLVMPAAFWASTRFGAIGLCLAWLVGFPLVAFVSARWSLAALGLGARQLWQAALPSTAAAMLMGLLVYALLQATAGLAALPRLLLLMAAGALSYGACLRLIWPEVLAETRQLLRRSA